MGCTNCGKKVSKADSLRIVNEAQSGKEGNSPTPLIKQQQLVNDASKMTYEAIKERRSNMLEDLNRASEASLAGMTFDMRRIFVEELVNVINCEEVAPAGSNADQATVTLNRTLKRRDFESINEMYPGLQDEIEKRCKVIIERRIDLSSFK